MATCRDCLHYEVCGGFTPTDLDRDVFDYCREGRADEIPDIEERCNLFKDKSQYAEVKRGEWIRHKTLYKNLVCSRCKAPRPFRKTSRGYHVVDNSNYCPNCGAKMDGGNNG